MGKPTRVCVVSGCPRSAEVAGRCQAHALPSIRPDHNPEQRRYYVSRHWKAIRALVIQQEPVCGICHANPTTNVDHIDGDWRHEQRSNLRGLCTTCERSHTGRQHALKRGGTINKRAMLNGGRVRAGGAERNVEHPAAAQNR